jgi:ATP-dependent Clp protease ATP-binding subunit ClpC
MMYERFTDRARKVMQLANQEASRFNHEYVGTEHILLGLIKEGSGVAANVLKNMDIDLRKVRLEVEKLVQPGPDMITMGKLPQTPRTKRVIEYTIEEARNLNHNYVGTEHILLGLMREKEGVAAQVLSNLGVSTENIRENITNIIGLGIDDQTTSDKKKIDVIQKKMNVIRWIARVAVHGVCGDTEPQETIDKIREHLAKI